MTDLVEMLKERAQMIRLYGRIVTEKNVCGFRYRFERGTGFLCYGPNGYSYCVSRHEVLDVFDPWELALAHQEVRREIRKSLAVV